MIRLSLVIVVTLLLTGTAQAADWKPFVALSVGESLDTLTTYRFLKGTRCVEGNSRLGRYPTGGRLIVWTAIPVATTALASYVLGKSPVKGVRILGKALSYSAGGWGGYHAVQNVRHCGF